MIEDRDEASRIGGLSTTSTSGATKGTAIFGLACWLLCWGGHAFVLALLRLLAWPLMERSLGVERLLSASPDALYKRC